MLFKDKVHHLIARGCRSILEKKLRRICYEINDCLIAHDLNKYLMALKRKSAKRLNL